MLGLLLGPRLLELGCALVLTGAMKPADVEGYDGAANLQQAVQVGGGAVEVYLRSGRAGRGGVYGRRCWVVVCVWCGRGAGGRPG